MNIYIYLVLLNVHLKRISDRIDEVIRRVIAMYVNFNTHHSWRKYLGIGNTIVNANVVAYVLTRLITGLIIRPFPRYNEALVYLAPRETSASSKRSTAW